MPLRWHNQIKRLVDNENIEYICVGHGKMVKLKDNRQQECSCCRNNFVMIARRRKEPETPRYECEACGLKVCLNCLAGQLMWKTE